MPPYLILHARRDVKAIRDDNTIRKYSMISTDNIISDNNTISRETALVTEIRSRHQNWPQKPELTAVMLPSVIINVRCFKGYFNSRVTRQKHAPTTIT